MSEKDESVQFFTQPTGLTSMIPEDGPALDFFFSSFLFLALNIYFGIKSLPELKMYWSTDPLIGVQAVKKVMNRNRFDKISQYHHLKDKEKALPSGPNYNKL